MGSYGGFIGSLWGPMEQGVLIGSYGVLWDSMGSYRVLWGLMGL